MMKDIKNNKVNCVIVKDFSRFGREHIQSSEYIEQVFLFMEARFIAVNDNYGSLHEKESNSIVITFSNLMNDHVCKDISIKRRSTIKVKCQNSKFVSSFVPYGYQKDRDNKNKLVIDVNVCDIIKIFSYKIQGMSADGIANELNRLGVLSPMEYKVANNTGFNTTFKTKNKAKWSAKAILRILSNQVYMGTLAQCKKTTPSHKVKKIINKPKDEWILYLWINCH